MNRSQKNNGKVREPLQALSRKDYLTAILLSILTLGAYAFTAAPGVTMEDSGDFIMGVLTLGIVHAPGYPLYTILGHLFSLLPLGDPAFRVNLFSALWGSLCLGVLFLNLRILSIAPLHAAFAILSLGFTTVFWSKTAVAEVYTFNAFLLASIVFWILSYNREKKNSQFYLACLTTGLALSNHYPLTILSSLGLLFLLDRKELRLTDFLKGSLSLVLGLTPYLYLFIQAYNPEIDYNMGKISNFEMVIDHILRKNYNDDMGGTLWDKFYLALWFLQAVITNFLITSLLLIYGITTSFLQRRKYRYSFLLAVLGPSLGLILILAIPSDDRSRAWILDFTIPAFLFLSIFLAFGLKALMTQYVKNKITHVFLLTILLLTQVAFNLPTASHHNDRLADIWGTKLLNSLRPNSILVFCQFGQLPIYYLQLIKGLRPDIAIYDRHSFFTKHNLYGPGLLFEREYAIEYRKRREQELINTSFRPVYYTCKHEIDVQNFTPSHTPYVFRADKRHLEASDATQFTLNEPLLDMVVNGYPKSDYWLDRLRRMILKRLITYYGGHAQPEINKIVEYFKKTKFYSEPPSILSLANNLYFFKNYDLARSFYDRAEQLSLEAFSSTDLAVYCSLLGNARDYDRALAICMRQEQSSVPCEVNTVNTRQTIAAIHKEMGDWPKVAQYSRRILDCQPDHPVARSYLELATQKPDKRQPTTELIATDEPK